MANTKPKHKVSDFKDRMTSPIGIVMTNPKTRKPKTTKKRGK